MSKVVPTEQIERAIFLIRGQKVMLDKDLAELYGIPTKRLNEQVKRNIKKFPDDFMFRLTREEFKLVQSVNTFLRSQSATSMLMFHSGTST